MLDIGLHLNFWTAFAIAVAMLVSSAVSIRITGRNILSKLDDISKRHEQMATRILEVEKRLEAQITVNGQRLTAHDVRLAGHDVTMAEMKERLSNVITILNRIEGRMEERWRSKENPI